MTIEQIEPILIFAGSRNWLIVKIMTDQGIAGIGVSRRRELLRQLGGIQEIKSASVEALTKVRGISPALAQKIFDALHHDDK